jgi:hypothetical protein
VTRSAHQIPPRVSPDDDPAVDGRQHPRHRAGASASPLLASDTTVTLSVVSGGLSIASPESADIGSGTPGNVVSGQLGSVTVSDERAIMAPEWTVTVSATAFTTGGATSAETIPATDVTYWSGQATATTGTGTFTPAQPTQGDAEDVPTDAFSHSGGNGNNSATWNPTLNIGVPFDGVGGTYTGTVTHSFA